MENIILWIGGGSVIASILIGLIKKFIKDIIEPRWGDLGIHLALGMISLLIALIYWGFQFLPSEVLFTMSLIFSGAIAIYQVLIKSIYRKAIRGKIDLDDKFCTPPTI